MEEDMFSQTKLTKWIPLLAFCVLFVSLIAACSSNVEATETPGVEEPAKPSNSGAPGDAVNLTGNVQTGKQVYEANCLVCHGLDGKDDVANPGSADGTVPALNPIDPTIVSSDPKTYATNIDLFIQNGSTPEGTSPEKSMPAFGKTEALTQQQIADVIAYIISLNQ
jgi:mono/diheme cytochrome c family protein